MIAVDTNLLIYAHRAATPQHERARQAIERAASLPKGFGVAVFCLAEFWGVVTHPAAAGRPSSAAEVTAFFQTLTQHANMQLWSPKKDFGNRLLREASQLGVHGRRIFDLQIGITARDHGATEIWTHDAGFVALPGIVVIDPLAAQ